MNKKFVPAREQSESESRNSERSNWNCVSALLSSLGFVHSSRYDAKDAIHESNCKDYVGYGALSTTDALLFAGRLFVCSHYSENRHYGV